MDQANQVKYRLVRSAMIARGVTISQIARKLGVTRQHVSYVMAGERKSPRVIRTLIEAGVPVELLAPEDCGLEVNEQAGRSAVV